MNYEVEINKLNARLDNLQQSFIQAQKNQVPITAKTDTSYGKCPQVDKNTAGVSENDSAICDVAELSDVNSMAIDDLAEMADTNSLAIDDLAEIIDDLEQRVEALEKKNNEE